MITFKCRTCNKFLNKNQKIFCSYSCRNKNREWKKCLINKKNHLGSKNPRWKGGRSIGYRLRICKKELIKANRDLTKCERCNKIGNLSTIKSGDLDIHHIDRNKKKNIASNLLILCKSCHTKEHWKERRKNEIKKSI